ncbi:50S ribosomal protein L18, chloroplastic-like [Coffea eugenioides]|uniref:Large ribosomal subunit protein uL18c n=1 Tax=Coffea arabica TaxID=13443 RepID=A0A6P6UP05_COFAR|nr:50S ribosomal protein L18, chloroplastic-like [Coffea arabica]XP_027149169.1 50S ribosomal protein L18, chloroplastic-like [Coffea eugenioides]
MSCNAPSLSFGLGFRTPKFASPFLPSPLPLSSFSTQWQPNALSIEAKAGTRREDRTARHSRIRKKVIDDSKMHTLASASTMQKPISDYLNYSSAPTIDVAKKVGKAIAKSCLEKGITKVAFDRGGYPYHGRIQALADAAREHGLQF